MTYVPGDASIVHTQGFGLANNKNAHILAWRISAPSRTSDNFFLKSIFLSSMSASI